MRRKTEEELAKLAFGDLPADEAMKLELRTQADPEAAKTFETYRRMKGELQLLGQDVPEDQLSKERLRQAILTRGLQHSEPAAQRGSWLWMPAAAAVLAFGVFYAKGRLPIGIAQAPVVVDKTQMSVPDIGIGVTRPKVNLGAEKVSAERTMVVSVKPATQVAMGVSRVRKQIDRSLAAMSVPPTVGRNDLPEGASGLNSFERAVADASTPSVAGSLDFGGEQPESTSAPKAQAPSIILIQSETDASTGTLRATEVGDTANVLVGG